MEIEFSPAQNLLAALLFGKKIPNNYDLLILKRLGIYHLFVFSGFHVYFWMQLLRRVFGNFIDGRKSYLIGFLGWFFLVVMYLTMDQGWAARRALAFQLIIFIFPVQINSSQLKALSLQVTALFFLILWDTSALNSMGVWMSICGSLVLSNGGKLFSGGHLSNWLLNCLVCSLQWVIAGIFGVYFSLYSGIVLGFILAIILQKVFQYLLLLFLISLCIEFINIYLNLTYFYFFGVLEKCLNWVFSY